MLNVVNNLGNLYAEQGKPFKAERMYEEAPSPNRTLILQTVGNLDALCVD
jgi:hypothetical protein